MNAYINAVRELPKLPPIRNDYELELEVALLESLEEDRDKFLYPEVAEMKIENCKRRIEEYRRTR